MPGYFEILSKHVPKDGEFASGSCVGITTTTAAHTPTQSRAMWLKETRMMQVGMRVRVPPTAGHGETSQPGGREVVPPLVLRDLTRISISSGSRSRSKRLSLP
jgi:hypothetical protein